MDKTKLETIVLTAGLMLITSTSFAEPNLESLKGLSLEELADMRVSIVSKMPERVADSAAAVYVLTADDIRRSGYTTIPELLRLVPGMNVARIDSAEWAISTRGFNGRFANKLLVMIDGRSVYNSLFSGVYWEGVDTLLPDVERIEVIRGPGASTWGANAVNGVINIITKHASDTQGVLASAYAGDQQSGVAGRYGTRVGESGVVRAYVKYDEQDPQGASVFGESTDRYHGSRFGARGDWDLSADDSLTVQGELYQANAQDPWLDGGNLMLNWEHIRESGAVDTLQMYYSRLEMQASPDSINSLGENEDSIDLEYRHHFAPMGRHNLITGLGYRWQQSDITGGLLNGAEPPKRSLHRYSAFVQDEISLLEDRWYLTLGTKLEHNDFTGSELQPSIRTRWHPDPDSTLWAAISRSIRTPSRSEHDLLAEQKLMPASPATMGLPVYGRTTGSNGMESEELIAYELGYRWRPVSNLGLDMSIFYNDYAKLRTMETGAPGISFSPFPRVLVPVDAENKMEGRTYGLEFAADWHPTPDWRLQAWYALLKINLKQDADSVSIVEEEAIEGQSPEHQAGLRSGFDLPYNLELDLFARYVSQLPDYDVDAYLELDVRLGWRATSNLSLELVGRNLLESSHLEFGQDVLLGGIPYEIKRELFLRAELRY